MLKWIVGFSVGISLLLALFMAIVVLFLSPEESRRVLERVAEPMVDGVDQVEGPVVVDRGVSVLAVGDIMLGRHVETLATIEGWDSRFAHVTTFFEEQDYVIANLEGPVPEVHHKTPDFTTRFSFKREAIEALAKAGVDAVSLANNHTMDFGANAYDHTGSVLDELAIDWFGHPQDASGVTVKTVTVNNETLVLIGFNDVFGVLNDEEAVETVKREAVKIVDEEATVMVFIHWGTEYETTSSENQRALARRFVEAGAEAVIGHHPHVRQEWEDINGVPVFYSLGNFLFDQYFSEEVQRGLAVKLTVLHGEVLDAEVFDVLSERSVPSISPRNQQ